MKRSLLVFAALSGLACSGLGSTPAIPDAAPLGAPAEAGSQNAGNNVGAPATTPGIQPAAASPLAPAATSAGVPVVAPKYGYKLTLPVGFPAPTSETTEVPTAIGNISTEMLTSCTALGTCIMANGATYPDVAFTAQTIDTMLNGARDGAVTNVGGTLTAETPITVNGNPGRDFQLTASNSGITFYVRSVIVVKRPNLIMVQWLATDPGGRTTPEANAMFSSLVVE